MQQKTETYLKMPPLFCFFAFVLLIAHASACETTSCGGIDIRFPFGLKTENQSRCSYNPNFQLRCDNQSRTILTLPNAGDLVVKRINYEYQTLDINDPNKCLPRRFLHNNLTLSLSSSSSSTFQIDPALYNLVNLTFLRCHSNVTELYPGSPISCLADPSNSSYSVISVWSQLVRLESETIPGLCDVVSSAFVPISGVAISMWPIWPDLTGDLELAWTEPYCGDCETQGEDCGFAEDTGRKIGCFSRSQKESSGLPRSAKYGLTIGVGIPGLLCLIGLSCFVCGKIRMYAQRRQPRPSIELPNSIVLRPGPFVMSLDGSVIEKYPKTLLGESGRLPKPNDNTCPICLSEYQPKQTLRTIPECNHYFHAHCIDEWLKMNATCPVCRNSPSVTSSSSSSSLSHSSSLSSLS